MKKYIGKRIISFLIVLVGVSILSFLLIAWSGKDPAEIIAHRGVSNPTPEQIEMIRVEMGLDQPLPVRYIQWLSGMFTGELGTSLTTHQPIVKDLHKYLAKGRFFTQQKRFVRLLLKSSFATGCGSSGVPAATGCICCATPFCWLSPLSAF